MSSDHHVHPSHTLGDVLIHLEARVSQGNDLVEAQRLQLVHLNLECLHFICELQVRSLGNRKKKQNPRKDYVTWSGVRSRDNDGARVSAALGKELGEKTFM